MEKTVHGVTVRSVVIGAAAVALLSIANPYLEWVVKSWGVGNSYLMGGAVLPLFALVLLNTVVVRFRPGLGLSRTELLVIYSMLICTLGWLINGGLPFLVSLVTYPFYMATPSNDWQHLMWPHIPNWLQLSTPEAVTWFWEGLPPGQSVPWAAWLQPGVAWTAFTAVLMASMFCLAALFRKDWIESQRLTFPLTDVPLAITGDQRLPTLGTSAMRGALFWIGFAVPTALGLLSWVHKFAPAVPDINLWMIPIGERFAGLSLPWSVLRDVRFSLSWTVFGVMCLLPNEVVLSLWFFYAVYRLWLVGCATFGLTPGSGQTAFDPEAFFTNMEAGAAVALTGVLFYQSRHTIARAARDLFHRSAGDDDPYAPMSARSALLGFVATTGVMLWFAMAAGMSFWATIALIAMCDVTFIAVSRVVAAGGVTFVHTGFMVRPVLIGALGTQGLGASSLTLSAYFVGTYMDDPTCLAMPQMLNAFKLGHAERIKGKAFPWVMAVAIGTLLVTSLPAILAMVYRKGGLTLGWWPFYVVGVDEFGQVESSLRSVTSADPMCHLALITGAALMLGVVRLYTQVVWWPVSPIGLVIASSWGTNYVLWAPALIAWLLTSQIKRYGGLRLYRNIRPIFLGLILGDQLSGGLLSVIDTVLNIKRLA